MALNIVVLNMKCFKESTSGGFAVFFVVIISFCVLSSTRADTKGNKACGVDGICECQTGIRKTYVVNCSNRNLEQVPQYIPSNTTSLFLDHNKIGELHEDPFRDFPSLQELNLSFNNLKKLPEGGFGVSNFVHTLRISNNFVGEIRRQHLESLSHICNFIMSHNSLSSLPEDLFINITLEQDLDFSYNQLISLPAKLFNTNNRPHTLSSLFLHRNRLTYIPANAFVGLPNLTNLCLFYNNIHELANDSFTGTGSWKIYLFGNDLSTLNSTYFDNENIKEIHVYGNNITQITDVALSGLAVNTTLFVDCQQVERLRHPHVEIICTTPKFVPVLEVDYPVNEVLLLEGFKCEWDEELIQQCFPCPRGTFGINGKCSSCPRGGFYQDEFGTMILDEMGIGCKKCPVGTYVKHSGGNSIEDCANCPDGTNKMRHAGYRACFCLEKYSRRDRFGQCLVCLEKGISCNGTDYMSIQPGFYWNWEFPGANLTEYKNFVKNLDTQNWTYDSFIKYDGQIPRTFQCPRRKSCKTIPGNIEMMCIEGYKGWLCSKCQTKFYSVLNYCLPCPNFEWLYIELALLCCFCVIIYAVVYQLYKRDNRRNTGGRYLIDIIISRGKIVLGYYQVVGEFFESVHDIYWAKSLKFIGDVVSLIELNIFRLIIRPKCFDEKLELNPKIEFWIAILFPCFLICLSLMSYQIMVTRYKCKQRIQYVSESLNTYAKKLRSKIFATVLVLLFITYPPICTSVFQLYPRACETFCLDKEKITCKTLLRSDYDIHCKDLKTYHIVAFITTAVYVVGFPITLFLLLRKESKLGVSDVPQGTVSAINDETDESELQNLLDDPSRRRTNPMWVNFLCENYKPQFWYWEIIELTRKVMQTVLITLLGWENKLTVLLTIGISVLYLTLHARYMPMKSRFEQRLQMFSLTAILANVLVATMEDPGEYGDEISEALIILNVLVIAIVAAEVFFGLFIRLKHGKVHKKIFKLVISGTMVIVSIYRKRSSLNEDHD